MKIIILSGGLGTRISERTQEIPKPMIEVGGKPLLWHIMQSYSNYGMNDFLIALGYRQEVVKSYFLNYYALNHDLSIDFSTGVSQTHEGDIPKWNVSLIDTGMKTQTGGRLKKLKSYIGSETFMMTYGDGLCDVNIEELLKFHKSHGKLATVTAVHPPPRFGGMKIKKNQVTLFSEKPQEGWVNGGYFVLEPEVLEYVRDEYTMWEKEPLEFLAKDEQLMAFQHEGFWHSMDTLRDHRTLEEFYQRGYAPWLHKKLLTSSETKKMNIVRS